MTDTSPASPEAQNLAAAEPVIVRRLVSELVKRGMDPAPVCRGLGFDVADLESVDLRISYAQVSKAIRRALPLLGDPQLALRLGASANLVSWGFCFVGLMASARSRAVLEFAVDFLPSTGQFLHINGQDDEDAFSVVVEARYDEPEVFAFLVDATFGALMQVCHKVVGPTFGPVSVDLTTSRPASDVLHEEVFLCPVRFDQASNRMNFSLHSVPVATADSLVAKRSREFLALQQSGARAISELEAAVIRAVRGHLRSPPELRDVAASVHMTERTLRRRLAETGLAFADIVDHERMRHALPLIREGRLPLAAVATETGFADARSLRRATKRWSGQTASQIREKSS